MLYYKRKRRKILCFIVFPILIIFLFFYFYFQVSNSFISLSEDKVYAECFNLINSIISNEITKIGTQNIIEYKYDTNGNIIAVNANVVTMNILNSKIADEIINQLSNLNNVYVDIPLGSFFSSNLFSAIGPNIPIKIIPLSTVYTDYTTEFTSTGINQTQHKIFIKVNCKVAVLSSLVTNTQEIIIEIPIAETIIIGGVPNTYITIPNQPENTTFNQ